MSHEVTQTENLTPRRKARGSLSAFVVAGCVVASCAAKGDMPAEEPAARATNDGALSRAAAAISLAPTPAAVPSVPQTAPQRQAFDRSKLAKDVESCVGRDGKYIRCIARVVTGNRPKSLGFSPDGKELWVSLHYDKPAVAVYDTTSFALIGAVELGQYGAVELHFSADNKRVYFSQFETATVYEVDRAERVVTRTFATGSRESKVVELSPDGATMWVANWSGNNISEFDLVSGAKRRTLKTPGIPRGLFATADGKSLYAAGFTPGRLYRFDRATGSMTIVSEKGASLRHLVGDESRGRLYISDLGGAAVWTYDMSAEGAGAMEKLADTDPKPNTLDLTPDGRVLYVSCRGRNNPSSYLNVGPDWGTVLAFDALTGRILDAAVGGNQTTGLDVSGDGRLMATSDFLDNRINIYELAPTAALLGGKGGAAKTRGAAATKTGNWGKKTPRDPMLWQKLQPSGSP